MIPSAKAGRTGFTLLEMIIALFILMLLLGMAVMGTRNVLADEELRDAVNELQIFAKTARKLAVEKNRPQELVLKERSWELRQLHIASETDTGKSLPSHDTIQTYELPGRINWKIKRWGQSKWEEPKELVWVFTPAGLCASHRFRFERNSSWMEFSFNPLTANPQNEDFYLP